jgi:hypothetical protein
MDTYIRTNSGAPLITPWSARGMSDGKYASVTAANAKKTEVQTDAFKAFEAPKMKSAETSKSNVRQKLQAIAKRLQILKKLFAGNPKEMAKALAQVFKELKAALKEYKAATDKELGGSDAAVSATLPAGITTADTADTTTDEPTAETASDPKADTETRDTTAQDQPETTPETASDTQAPPAEDRTALYSAVEGKVRQMVGDDGLDFIRQLKGMVNEITGKMLAPARIQMKAQKSDKDTEKAFEDVDKELKDLRKDMEDMARDIKHDVPTVGMTLDVAA